jgi:membrane-associated phospholipid phosphatase
MIEALQNTDQTILLAINQGLQNAFLDVLCPFMRKQSNWYVLYAIVVGLIIFQYKRQSLWLLLGAALLVFLSDQISANLIKNSVQRLRPCNNPDLKEQIRALVGCGSGYSFVSAHAANHFAIAIYLYKVWGKQYKLFLPIALVWASLIAFSQVYVGVHYPTDVLAGAFIGIILAFLVSQAVIHYAKLQLIKL